MRLTLVLTLALTASCSGSHKNAAAPPAAPAAPAAVTAKVPLPFKGTRAQAETYLREAILSCPESISLQVLGGVDEDFCDHACNILNELTGAWCYRYSARGEELTIDIRYTDYALMLGVHEGRLPASRLSAAQTLAYARAIVAEAMASHSDAYELALALHDYLALNCRYIENAGEEGHTTSLLLRGQGLCENYAGTYYLLARMAGLDCLYVEGRTKGTGHVWNLVRLGGQWVHVDCTYDDPTPDRPGKVQRHYFAMDDATIAKSHQWDRDRYPACPANSLWYPAAHIPHFATVDDMVLALLTQADAPGGGDSLEGYVEELARQPQRASALLREAVDRYRRSMSLEQSSDSAMAGFITLTLKSGRRPGAGR